MAGTRIEGSDLALDAELGEQDLRAVDPNQFLAPAGRSRQPGIELDDDALGGDLDHVGHVDLEPGHAQRELAGHVHAEVAAEQAEDVELDVEGAEDPDKLRLDPAVRLLLRRRVLGVVAAEGERGPIHADRDRQDQHPVLEVEVRDADRWPEDLQRSDGEGLGRIGRARRRGLEREFLLETLDVLGVRDGGERAADELDGDLSSAEELDPVVRVLVLQVVAVRPARRLGVGAGDEDRGADEKRSAGRRIHGQVGNAGAGDLELVAVDAGGIDGAAVLAHERHVDVAPGVQRLRCDRLAVAWARELSRGRRLVGGARHDVELLGLAEVARAAVVGERLRQERDRHQARGTGEPRDRVAEDVAGNRRLQIRGGERRVSGRKQLPRAQLVHQARRHATHRDGRRSVEGELQLWSVV